MTNTAIRYNTTTRPPHRRATRVGSRPDRAALNEMIASMRAPAATLSAEDTAWHYASQGNIVWLLADDVLDSAAVTWTATNVDDGEYLIDMAWNRYTKQRMLGTSGDVPPLAVLITPAMFRVMSADTRAVANWLRVDGHRFGVHCEITVDGDREGAA